jgi:hypothetical protein
MERIDPLNPINPLTEGKVNLSAIGDPPSADN